MSPHRLRESLWRVRAAHLWPPSAHAGERWAFQAKKNPPVVCARARSDVSRSTQAQPLAMAGNGASGYKGQLYACARCWGG